MRWRGDRRRGDFSELSSVRGRSSGTGGSLDDGWGILRRELGGMEQRGWKDATGALNIDTFVIPTSAFNKELFD